MAEKVYHPDHYNREGRKECWDEMINIFGADAVAIFDCLNAYKHFYRAGVKEGEPKEQDVEKLKRYLEHAFDTIIKAQSEDALTRNAQSIEVFTKVTTALGIFEIKRRD